MADRPWNSDALAGDAWFRIGNFDVTTSALIPFVGAVSMLVYGIDQSLFRLLEFESLLVTDGQLWRLVTWPIPNPPDIFVVLGLFLFYLWGTQIERILGRIKFLVFVALLTVVPAVLFSLVQIVFNITGSIRQQFLLFGTSLVGGVRLLEIGLLVVVAISSPHMKFFFGIPARVMAAVFVAIDLLRFLGDRLWGPLWFEVAVIVVAVLLMKPFGLGEHVPRWVPAVPIPGLAKVGATRGPKRATTARSATRRTSKGAVVTGPWGERGTGTATDAAPSATRAGLNRNDREEVDRLLDKIAASGMGSLSAAERQQLEEASKRLRESGQ
jgi:hypothetical protein